ncbi:hypothetical protein LCGC14_1162170 [marine sediment metagenome]|uniref:Uncharacterized protein n=1 Tax=marine sediment metagenome TaxID=412755 RepID=A0A0F9LS73_9ZZZZ
MGIIIDSIILNIKPRIIPSCIFFSATTTSGYISDNPFSPSSTLTGRTESFPVTLSTSTSVFTTSLEYNHAPILTMIAPMNNIIKLKPGRLKFKLKVSSEQRVSTDISPSNNR